MNLTLEGLQPTATEFEPYHGKPKRSAVVSPELREFIAWDGEGQNLKGPGKPQSYVLFGCSTGDRILQSVHIHTFELLDFILDIGQKYPTAFHVGFAFNYDANMILQSLSEESLKILHEEGRLSLKRKGLGRYTIHFIPSKWFSVTKFLPGYDRKRNPHAKLSVRIYDMFTFFAKGFVAAYEEYIGPVPDVVTEGKKQRDDFGTMSLVDIERYWRAEVVLMQQLAEELRRRLYGAGLRITQWHGPGALASYALRQHGIKAAMATCPPEVREAARYGYAGGRFERFLLGRTTGPIYSLDINSAYPFAITRLPNLSTGRWVRNARPDVARLAKFGIYRVRLNPVPGDSYLQRPAGPLFHRDPLGNVSFPWILEGWYWTPEVVNLARLPPERYTIVEGWEYVGWTEQPDPYPFLWVRDTYNTRREWKEKGLGSQLALKLLLNSLYGKMAQRVGWNEDKRTAPNWHQLEWAGWVTSHCRAMLWDVMSRIPPEHLLAVETDGIYTTYNPELLGIKDSKELGGWEVKTYDEILYVQSGMAWLRAGGDWSCKRRGLDARTFPLGDCVEYLRSLPSGPNWRSYKGTTTRFIGVGAALMSSTPFKERHCAWLVSPREITPGNSGKRIHVHTQCKACAAGLTAYEGMHDMVIRSRAYNHPMSTQHDIPWEGDTGQAFQWREMEATLGEAYIP